MTKLRFRIAMSLDGFTAGPEQSRENPLGIGGLHLHNRAFPLAAWRAPHGLEGGAPRAPLALQGGTTFTCVTEGIVAALADWIYRSRVARARPGSTLLPAWSTKWRFTWCRCFLAR